MGREQVRARIEATGIVPAIRVSSAEDALLAAQAVAGGGIPIVELTMTVPRAVEVIAALVKANPDLIVGAGTVWDVETAKCCLDAGAMFLTSTGLDLDVVDFAHQRNVVLFPGALTPTEVMRAWKAGADFVKIFPCSQLGGAAYIKALKAPFPKVPLIASGGVNQQNVADFMLAGAVAVGVGGHLIPRKGSNCANPTGSTSSPADSCRRSRRLAAGDRPYTRWPVTLWMSGSVWPIVDCMKMLKNRSQW